MNGVRSSLDPVRFGLGLGVVAILFGWGLGLLFGAGEDWLRAGFIADGEANRAFYVQKAGGEEDATALINRVDEAAFNYFIRAHLHAGAIGSIAIGASLLLALLSVSPGLKSAASSLLGFGAVAYPLFWMWAGLRAPSLGSTGAAKETLRWLAWPSSAALMAGGVLTLVLVLSDLFVRRSRRA